MTDSNEHLKNQIDGVWREKAIAKMRSAIARNLLLVSSGEITKEELAFALSTLALSQVMIIDSEVEAAVSSDGFDEWNELIARRPDVCDNIAAEQRLMTVQDAALDVEAMERHKHLPVDEAIDAIIAERPEDVAFAVRYEQAILAAMAKNGWELD